MAKKASFEEKYMYYTLNFEKKIKRYRKDEREELREDRFISAKWFEINYNAAKEYLIENHKKTGGEYKLRPSYKRIIETMVNKTLYAYEPSAAQSIARYYNQQNPEEKISYVDLLTGRIDKSKLELNRIYKEKEREYFEMFPQFSESSKKDISNARKYAKEWISRNIFGSP